MANVREAMKKAQAEQAAQSAACQNESAPAAQPAGAVLAAQAASVAAASKESAAAQTAADATTAVLAVPAAMCQPGTAGAGANGYADVLIAHHDQGGRISEQYRALRTSLMSQYNDGKFCLMVTSAEMNEGKTVTCLNLAVVLAERQECRTLVIDGDLRKSRVATLLGMDNSLGVSDVVLGKATLRQAARPTAYPNLFVVPAGPADPDQVGQMLGRPEFAEMIAQAISQYDYVLLDTPPVNAVSDAGIMGRIVTGALVVVRMNKTRRESVDRAVRLLHAANVKVSGLVLTHLKYHIPNYLYRYS